MSALRLRGARLVLTVGIGLLLPGAPAAAVGIDPGRPRPEQSSWARVELRADLQSLFHFKNDSDFDRSPPTYDENGQTVGAFATLFTPRVTLHMLETLRITYEVELGLNFWSKQNPDQQDALASDVFVLKHREIFGEGELLDGKTGFKVGYSHFRDPTGLFVAHWIGMAQAHVLWPRQRERRLSLFVGQIPDQVYEGILLDDNNFKRDIWVFGGRTDVGLTDRTSLAAALTGLVDTHLAGQARWIACPSLHLESGWGRWGGFLDLALQGGQLRGQALDGGNQRHIAWAAQGQVRLALHRLDLQAGVLALSPDDAYVSNDWSHAFLYSGKSRSPTLMLTEDELRDWYDNVDERASGYRGGLFQNRAGLFLGDLRATWHPHDRVQAALIVGAATVLKPRNAGDGKLVGVETDLHLALRITDYLFADVVVGALIPGKAGGALLNRISADETDPIVMTELSLLIRY